MTRHGHLRRIILGAGALAACCAAARAQDPNAAALEVFQSLYGEQVRAVQATGKSDDDVELAGKLLSAARQAEANAALRALLCEKVHELAHKLADLHQPLASVDGADLSDFGGHTVEVCVDLVIVMWIEI